MMRTRGVLIRLTLTEDESVKFEGRNAMVVPLSQNEVGELRDKIILSHDGLMKLARALATLSDALETTRGAVSLKSASYWNKAFRLKPDSNIAA